MLSKKRWNKKKKKGKKLNKQKNKESKKGGRKEGKQNKLLQTNCYKTKGLKYFGFETRTIFCCWSITATNWITIVLDLQM